MKKHDEFVEEAVRTMKMGHCDWYGYFDDLLQRVELEAIASHEAEKKPITDHDLSKIAEEWFDNLNSAFIGRKTAFAAGYRVAERKLLKPYQPEGKEEGK